MGNYNEYKRDECSKQETECGSYATTLKYLITIINRVVRVLSTAVLFTTGTASTVISRCVFRNVFRSTDSKKVQD